MAENKINKKLFSFSFLGLILITASYLIYTVIPQSDLANSIDRSGMDAVYVLTLSPVFALLAVILLAVSYFTEKKYIESIIPAPIAICTYAVTGISAVISVVFSVMFVISQYGLGFTAPIDGTVWESRASAILISCIIHLIFTAFVFINMKGVIFKKSK